VSRLWWIALLVITALRVWAAAVFPLQGTEAYYWMWSQHLALGYYDHPPLLAWAIRACTDIFGRTEFAVRLPSLLGGTVGTVLVWWLGVRIGGPTVGARAGLTALLVPYMSMVTVVAFTDGPMWGFCAFSMVLAWQQRWLASGVMLGLGLLTKFTAALVGVAELLWRGPRPVMLGWALLAVAAVSPFLYWNAENNWITFGFQLRSRHHVETILQPLRFLEFLGLQALTVSPLLWGCLLSAVVWAWRQKDEAGRFLGIHFAVPMAPFVAFSFFHKIEPQWPLIAYFPAFVALGLACEKSAALARWWRPSIVLGGALTLFMLSLPIFPQTLFWIYRNRPEGVSALQPFAFAEMAQAVASEAGDRFIVTQDHGFSSVITFYSGVPAHWFSYNLHGREFLNWEDYPSLKGRDALFVDWWNPEKREGRRWLLEQAFEQVGHPKPLLIKWHGRPARTFEIWECKGFRGKPPDYTITRLPFNT